MQVLSQVTTQQYRTLQITTRKMPRNADEMEELLLRDAIAINIRPQKFKEVSTNSKGKRSFCDTRIQTPSNTSTRKHFLLALTSEDTPEILAFSQDDLWINLLTKAFQGQYSVTRQSSQSFKQASERFLMSFSHDEEGVWYGISSRSINHGVKGDWNKNGKKEGIDYDEVFAPVARIEAIRLFLAFASFMGFIVYQMDVKSAFLYGTIDEEVYVSQPPGLLILIILRRFIRLSKLYMDFIKPLELGSY
ncbi:putative ribonuclease H-like domain-containing protein [Tanacetum coccineum]